MYDETYFGYEDMPYKKFSKKSKPKKSNHKHEYADCLITQKDTGNSYRNFLSKQYWRAKYCIHCGHIYNVFFYWNNDITEEEINTLPKFKVDDIFSTREVILQDKN